MTLIIALCLWGSAAFAVEDVVIKQAEQEATSNRSKLQAIELSLNSSTISEQKLIEQRSDLENIQLAANQQALALDAPLADINQQLTKLGPAPANGASEAPEIASQRKVLDDTLNRLKAAKTQLALIAVEAGQASARAAAIQRDQFISRIFEPSRSILNPYLWLDAATGFTILIERQINLVETWWRSLDLGAHPAKLMVFPALLLLTVVFWFFALRGLWGTRRNSFVNNPTPNNFDRLWIIVSSVATITLGCLAFIVVARLSLQSAGVMTARFELFTDAIFDFFLQTAFGITFIYRLAAPGRSNWRILNLDDTAAQRFFYLGSLATIVCTLSSLFHRLEELTYVLTHYINGISAVMSLIMLVLTALILINFYKQQGLQNKDPNHLVLFPKANIAIVPARILVVVAAIALLLGYISLSEFVIFRIFETAGAIIAFYVLHCLSDVGADLALDPQSWLGKALRRVTSLGAQGISRLVLFLRTSLDIILVIVALPFLFYLWSVTWVDFRSLVNRLSLGFTLGSITISPWIIFLIVVIFLVGVVLTKLFVRWLNSRVLAETHINQGVQNSISTAVTYAGYIIAAGIAITAAGLNLSSLAIVAGALSVGIGFGLQAITSNFISGLILLAERPVRVGDWVIVQGGEGTIKKINVRSTEIETFDGCSIIVPNSSLITEPVRNWTRFNTVGRIGIALTVAYGSDVNTVRQILMDAACNNEKVLKFPEPNVSLSNFASTGLFFELKAYVANISEGSAISSDLRNTIANAFKEKDIHFATSVTIASAGPA